VSQGQTSADPWPHFILDKGVRAAYKRNRNFGFVLMQTARVITGEADTFLRWVRPPQQARTRASLERILDAAEALIAERGFDGASIADIAQRAKSSVGGVYRRFRDKEGLLLALHERFCEEACATADEAFDPNRWKRSGAAAIINQFAAFLVQIYRDREGLLCAFLARATVDEPLRNRSRQLFAHIEQGLHALLSQRQAEISHPHPELAIGLGLHTILGSLNHTVQTGVTAVQLTDARLASELARLLNAYLGIGDTNRRPGIRSNRRGMKR
jgi:AcrR family transcriptional regulator